MTQLNLSARPYAQHNVSVARTIAGLVGGGNIPADGGWRQIKRRQGNQIFAR
jgi:hypothetical protein